MNKCGVNNQHKLVDCPNAHVTKACKILMNHYLVWSNTEIDLHLILLILCLNVKLNDEVWNLKSLGGEKHVLYHYQDAHI
jgi:hypothetical protein